MAFLLLTVPAIPSGLQTLAVLSVGAVILLAIGAQLSAKARRILGLAVLAASLAAVALASEPDIVIVSPCDLQDIPWWIWIQCWVFF